MRTFASTRFTILCLSALIAVTALSACDGPIKTEASYPTRPKGSDQILYSDQKQQTVFGDGSTIGDKIFGDKDNDKSQGATGLGVNSFLWRASLDTISFMPLASADPFGGVILTDWYENPQSPGERFKVNIYILDKQLRADGIRVAVFKQLKDPKTGWRDTDVSKDMATNIENSILSRARDMRVAQMGRDKN